MRLHYYLVPCILLLHISLVVAQTNPKIFDSLPTIEQYAASVVENPKIPIADWDNPDFSPYYKKTTPSFFEKYLISLGILHPLWDIYAFTELLKLVISEREYAGYQAPLIQKIEPIPGTSFYILSNLFGAFHSLVRDLRSLQKDGIIDESLKIIKPSCYIVFNGNIASRSAYALETLTVILRLLYVNKDSVIVTLGNHETDRHWTHYAIKHELKIRAASLQIERLPLGNLMEQFFNTLPAALYLIADREQDDVSVVRISNFGFENKELSSTACGNFFEKQSKKLCFINPKIQQKPTIDVTVRALIKGEPFYKARYTPTQGLLAAGKEEGAVTWATISGPIQSSQELFQFYHDAYVKLTTARLLDDWTLTLYNRDIREHTPIEPSLTVKLLSRQELNHLEAIEAQLKIVTDEKEFLQQKISLLDKKITMQRNGNLEDLMPVNLAAIKTQPTKEVKPTEIIAQLKEGVVPLGKQESTISVATIVDLSGITKIEGESVETGIKTVFNMFNKKGTLKGTTLDLITFDSKRQQGLPRQGATQALATYKTGLILLPLSTWALEDYIDLITKKQVLVLFPVASGAGPLRHKELTNMFFMRASGQQEASAITNHVARKQGGKKFVLFHAKGTWGKEALEGAQASLKKLNITDFIAVSSEETNLNLTEQVKTIKQFNPDSLGLFCVQEIAKELLNQLGTAWLTNRKLFGPQDLSLLSFRNYINRNKLNFFGTSVVPNPEGSLEIAQQYRDATAQMQILSDTDCFEAYIGADFFTYILEHIQPPITSQKISDFITNVHSLPFKGLTLDFDPEKRQLMHSIWLISNEKDWKEIKLSRPKPKEESSPKVNKEPVPLGEKEATLSLATVVDSSSITKAEGESVKTGIKVVFDKYNKAAPRTSLELITVDSQNKPEIARQGILETLKKEKTGLVVLPYSTLILESLLDLIEEQRILALFPIASGTDSISKTLTNIFFLRASGKYEGYALTRYIASEKTKKIALVYSNNSYGKTLLSGAEKALKEINNNEYITIPIEETYIDFTEQIKTLKKFDPDYIGMFTIQSAAQGLLNQLGSAWLIRKTLFGSQDLSPQAFRNYIERNKLNFICTSVVPNPDSSLEIAQQYRHETANLPISNDLFCFEAYIAADFFTHILQQIKEPITSTKIIEFIEQIHNYSYKGLTFDFDPEKRHLLHSVWLITKGKDWKELKLTRPANHKKTRPEKLNIGSILDLSRGDAVFGKTMKGVMEFLVDRANSQKEKDKPLIDLTIIDHEYTPDKARKAVETLLNTYHANIILCTVGSQTYAAFLDYINKGDVITLFPITVTQGKRSKIPNAIFLGATYQDQAHIAVNYCIEHFNMQRLAIFYQDDIFGQVLLEGAKELLDSKKINFTAIAYERNSTNFAAQVEQIKKLNPDTIGLFAVPEASIEFLRQLGEPYTKRIHFFGSNSLSIQIMTDFFTKNEIQCLRTNIVPNYKDQSLPLCKEFLLAMQESQIKPDTVAFETYISTQIFLDVVNKIEGRIDKQSILQACKEIHNVLFKGLMLNYDPEDNQLINYVWIDEGKQAPWIRIPLKKEDK